jgi:hypothetical protein
MEWFLVISDSIPGASVLYGEAVVLRDGAVIGLARLKSIGLASDFDRENCWSVVAAA